MRILIKITYALLGIVGIFLLLWFGMPEIRKTFQTVKMMSIVVKLDNQCTVADDTFIVTVPGTDLQFPIKNRIVRLRLRSDRKLQLKSNPKYPAIRYEGMHEEVKKNVVLVADCSSSPRIKCIFKSMNEKFNNK